MCNSKEPNDDVLQCLKILAFFVCFQSDAQCKQDDDQKEHCEAHTEPQPEYTSHIHRVAIWYCHVLTFGLINHCLATLESAIDTFNVVAVFRVDREESMGEKYSK